MLLLLLVYRISKHKHIGEERLTAFSRVKISDGVGIILHPLLTKLRFRSKITMRYT